MTRIPVPDVFVLLPGITGSVLERNGKEVWAPAAGAMLRGLLSLGRSVQQLEVGSDDWRVADLGDGVTATRLVPDVHVLPGFWKIDGYGEIESFLLNTFELEPGKNYRPFPYDWRRDNRAAAKRLGTESRQWLDSWRTESGNDKAQLVLIGHSMGGLVARYFVEALEGWKDTRAVVTFGTPYYGSLNALDFLLNGFQKGVGVLKVDLTRMLQSCASVHQLVPRYRCVFGADGVAVTPANAKLPRWKAEWTKNLDDFHDEMETAAQANRTDPAFEAKGLIYRPIVGTDQPTRQSARVVGSAVEVREDRGDSNEGGDGTVPLVSAALSGTEDQRTFAPQRHARLQNYDPMLDHLKGVLASLYQVRISDLRAAVTAWFSYDGEDIYLPPDPVQVRLRANIAVAPDLLPTVDATITVTDKETKATTVERRVSLSREWQSIELGVLPPGTYVVDVRGRRDTAPVSDVFVVAAQDELEAV